MQSEAATFQAHPYYSSWFKRFFDILLSLILLVILSPLFLLISLLILITTGWPIFYRQNRYGQDKKIFKIIKFRTMYVGAEKNRWRYQEDNIAPQPMYKNWHDPRFVGMGKFLAKTGLDELPQLFNILAGQMSIVGPRPLPVCEAKELNKSWNFRYQVRPGVFSSWSALFNKRHQSLREWRELEMTTLEQGGLTYELRVITRTMSEMLKS